MVKNKKGDAMGSNPIVDPTEATPTSQVEVPTLPLGSKQIEPTQGMWEFLFAMQGMLLHQQSKITRLSIVVERQQEDIVQLSKKCNELENVRDKADQVVNEQDDRVASLCTLHEQLDKLNKEIADLRMFGARYEKKRPSWASVVSFGKERSSDLETQDVRKENEIEKRKFKIIISGIAKKENETLRSMHEQVQHFLEHHFLYD